jgi:hypothetical protein
MRPARATGNARAWCARPLHGLRPAAARLEAKLGVAVFDGVAAASRAVQRGLMRRNFAGAPAAGLRRLT